MGVVIDRDLSHGRTVAVSPLWGTVLVLTTTGVAAIMTMVFLGMRATVEIGGACASGGPYVSAQPCPDGVGLIMGLGIPLGMILVFVNVAATFRLQSPFVAWLAWPALFLSLGYNFWDFGLNPPDGRSIAWSWIICGAVFVLMGAAPLVLMFQQTKLLYLLHPSHFLRTELIQISQFHFLLHHS